jgi:hypothetical protein
MMKAITLPAADTTKTWAKMLFGLSQQQRGVRQQSYIRKTTEKDHEP